MPLGTETSFFFLPLLHRHGTLNAKTPKPETKPETLNPEAQKARSPMKPKIPEPRD